MREEGDFLYYYVVCCFWFFFVVLVAACCVGSCIFTTGSLVSLSMVENMPREEERPPNPEGNRGETWDHTSEAQFYLTHALAPEQNRLISQLVFSHPPPITVFCRR